MQLNPPTHSNHIEMPSATLRLEDGTTFRGFSFGAHVGSIGEIVFSSAMGGYTESLTDPSYMGQILVSTYPMVGNYGAPSNEKDSNGIEKFWESSKIHISGLVVADYSEHYSHWNAVQSLGSWLQQEGVPALTGIDTRRLAQLLRDHGSMKAVITIGDAAPLTEDPLEGKNLVALASCTEVQSYGSGNKKIALVDCGVKNNILRSLLDPDFTLIRVPWDYDFTTIPDLAGVFLSNGPGSPQDCTVTIEHIRAVMDRKLPIFGICMGHQLLSLAAGGETFKLKYGHRGHNQPIRQVGTDRCFITSQNHGFAVDASTLGDEWETSYVNLNDGTNEGIRHTRLPFASVQFHPECWGGPQDMLFLFDEFKKQVKNQ